MLSWTEEDDKDSQYVFACDSRAGIERSAYTNTKK
jgi:hypothetical protein